MRRSLRLKLKRAVQLFAARNTPYEFPLLDLPTELIDTIIEHVDDLHLLCQLSRVCRRLQCLAEPLLYRKLLIRSGADARRILSSILIRSERSTGIHSLNMPCDNAFPQDFRAMIRVLTRAKNIQSLMFESPECNSGDFELEEEWSSMTDHLFQPFQEALHLPNEIKPSSRPLQRLQSVTLHINGPDSPYWALDERSIAIFLHPTLQRLKVSCLNIGDEVSSLLTNDNSTSLKHLELQECNITHEGLRSILRLPRGLESLYLGENIYNIEHLAEFYVDGHYNHLFLADTTASLGALSLQKGSLKSLTYVTTETFHRQLPPRGGPRHHVDGGFADFHSLEEITLIGQCSNFERAVMTSRSPPNLKSLNYKACEPFKKTIHSDGNSTSPLATIPFLRAPSCSVAPTLERIAIVYDSVPAYSIFSVPVLTRNMITSAAEETAKIGAGVELTVWIRCLNNYFPPFLWDDKRPTEEVCFAGATKGFVDGFSYNGYCPAGTVVIDDSLSDHSSDDS